MDRVRNHPLLSKDRTNVTYWIAAAVYAIFVALGSGGFFWFLSFIFVAFAARQGFPELVKMFLLTRETDAVSRFSTDKAAKNLVLVLAISAALYTIALPVTSPWIAIAATLVAVFGSKKVLGP